MKLGRKESSGERKVREKGKLGRKESKGERKAREKGNFIGEGGGGRGFILSAAGGYFVDQNGVLVCGVELYGLDAVWRKRVRTFG